MARRSIPTPSPRPTRPYMPGYGAMFEKSRGHLPWSWAAKWLSEAHNFWVATTRPDGRPHVTPVWGIWLDGGFYFSSGRRSRKSRNLRANTNCVVCPENAREAVILEGTAREVRDTVVLRRFAGVYKQKYDWDMGGNNDPVYRVTPRVAFGFIETPARVTGNPTRWIFRERSARKR